MTTDEQLAELRARIKELEAMVERTLNNLITQRKQEQPK